MAKLTLSFKDRKLKVFALGRGECLIGRDPQCSIVIASLAVEPEHARIHCGDTGYTLEAVNDQCSININGEPLVEVTALSEGDSIHIGKHQLSYSEESARTVVEPGIAKLPLVGWLQIQSGAHLGRTIRLDKAFTRIGKPDGQLAVIAHRDDGYYLSALQGDQETLLNDKGIGETSRILDNADRIAVGELQAQFFADIQSMQLSSQVPGENTEAEQRRFSRIPFDVAATLKTDRESWETGLLDVSLHGALIKTPSSFESTPDQLYQLAIHLEGGPDICMDVEIAHQEAGETGLNCKDIDVDSITHLRRLVELNLGDPELLERELSALG